MQDADFWSKMAPRYARAKIGDVAGYERSLHRTQPFLQGARVLELGCGTGLTAMALAPHAASYHATDIAPGMIEIAQGRLAETPVAGLSFAVAQAEDFGPDRFDVVFAQNYLHLLRDLPGTLAHIYALLPKGGVLIAKTPVLGQAPFYIRWLVPILQALGKAPFLTMVTAADLERALTRAGFACAPTEWHASSGRDLRAFIVARKV
ncbi:class I SAM-dependent methyltransferase [Roseibaca sp. Y0-43]|uniref:class I SAM-dependent methyltransferase n=1 Tax=Roseibaca sp. Y0-43 TaxID=2816854 RepID=UPI001D0C93CB|nr:class I SAM-dependent methyltransferase [Roseibaca sp. Y0-43]MCC1482551.1 class I SAM-dependent methyltransferase [Roseibaca sp. Y0-43]